MSGSKAGYNNMKKSVYLFGIGLSLLTVTGCATSTSSNDTGTPLERKFSGEKIPNIAHFAEQTQSLLGPFTATTLDGELYLLKDIINPEGDAERRYREDVKVINGILAGMRDYSTRLVAIAESSDNEAGRINAYHDMLKEYTPGLVTALQLPEQHFDATLEKVRQQPSLRKAILHAEPIIDAAVAHVRQELVTLHQASQRVADGANQRLQHQYQALLNAQAPLYVEKMDVLNAFVKELEQSKRGIKMSSATRQRLSDLNALQAVLASDWQHYQRIQDGLHGLQNNVATEVQRIGWLVNVWARAHKKMASGVYLPAEWFDLNDLPGQLIKRARL